MNLTALVVDDDHTNRSTLSKLLQALGYTVLQAEDGLQALNMFKANVDNIDVIITDYQMPVMDGRELLTEINNMHTCVKTIMITGMASGDPHQDSKDFPEPMKVIPKPFSFGNILTAFQNFNLATA